MQYVIFSYSLLDPNGTIDILVTKSKGEAMKLVKKQEDEGIQVIKTTSVLQFPFKVKTMMRPLDMYEILSRIMLDSFKTSKNITDEIFEDLVVKPSDLSTLESAILVYLLQSGGDSAVGIELNIEWMDYYPSSRKVLARLSRFKLVSYSKKTFNLTKRGRLLAIKIKG